MSATTNRSFKPTGRPEAALFIASLHRLRLRRHHVMIVVMIMVMDDHHHVVRFHHVRLSHFLHGHFCILSKGRDGEAK
jgi:hypothetical protein